MPALQLPSTVHVLVPVARAFGAGRLFALIIIVFLAIMAALIVPLEARLLRQRRTRAHQTDTHSRDGA